MGSGFTGADTLEIGRVIPDDIWGILCIFAEARGEPYEGQVAVGCVIRNRTSRKFFSNGTVVDTVTKPHQFSWMNTGDAQRSRVLSVLHSDPAWRVATKAWYESEVAHLVDDAVFYHASYVQPYWAKVQGVEFVKRIGSHLFYAEKDK